MYEYDRELQPKLSQQAWSVFNKTFFDPAVSGRYFPERIIATDGAEWKVDYLEFDYGPSVSLVRTSGDDIVAYELVPGIETINIARTTRSSSLEQAVHSIQFQTEMGTYIPVGDDLRPLEEFLLPAH